MVPPPGPSLVSDAYGNTCNDGDGEADPDITEALAVASRGPIFGKILPIVFPTWEVHGMVKQLRPCSSLAARSR